MSSSDLARGAFVTRQSMSVVLQPLATQCLIRRAGTQHGRALPVDLTTAGRKQLIRASVAACMVEERMLTDIDAQERAVLRRLPALCTGALRA